MAQHVRRRHHVGAGAALECTAGAPQFDAQPDEIGRADPLQCGEESCRSGKEGAQPQHRERHGGEVAQRHANRHRQRRAPALAQRIGHDQQHGRARNDEQDGRCRDEGGPEGEGHQRVKPWSKLVIRFSLRFC